MQRAKTTRTDPAAAATGLCPNCRQPAPGRFCAACGQRQSLGPVSVRRFVAEALDEQLSINGTLPRTLAFTLFRPGWLTAEYLRGRIASYVPPFRLYLVASVLFFLCLSVVTRNSAASARLMIDGQGVTIGARAGADSAASRPAAEAGVPATADTADAAARPGIDTGFATLDSIIGERVARLSGMDGAEVAVTIMNQLIENVPTAMFVLLPLFALLLKALHVRRTRYYMEHFIFALHYHAFAFLMFTALLFIPDALGGFFVLWIFLYLWLAMKRVYGQGLFRTTLKFGLLVGAYTIVVTAALLGVGLLAVLAL